MGCVRARATMLSVQRSAWSLCTANGFLDWLTLMLGSCADAQHAHDDNDAHDDNERVDVDDDFGDAFDRPLAGSVAAGELSRVGEMLTLCA
jgi:hypothetical protein